MRWIKATDHLPEKYGTYFCKYEDDNAVFFIDVNGELVRIRFSDGATIYSDGIDKKDLQWLDESEDETLVEKLTEFSTYLRDTFEVRGNTFFNPKFGTCSGKDVAIQFLKDQ